MSGLLESYPFLGPGLAAILQSTERSEIIVEQGVGSSNYTSIQVQISICSFNFYVSRMQDVDGTGRIARTGPVKRLPVKPG